MPADPLLAVTRGQRVTIINRLLRKDSQATLFLALCERRLDVVERVLQSGAVGVEEPGPDGQTPMHWAVLAKHLEAVLLLSRNGATFDSQWRGSPLLHLAVIAGSAPIAAFVIDQGVDPDERDADGNTALHLACLRGSRELADALLRKGVDKRIVDADGNTAMQLWNDASEHPYVHAAQPGRGAMVRDKSMFHWFTTFATIRVDEQRATDRTLLGGSGGAAGAAPDAVPTYVVAAAAGGEAHTAHAALPDMFRFVVDRAEVAARLHEVYACAPGGMGVPTKLERDVLADVVGDREAVTFDEFSRVWLSVVAR
jgi:hypothetical protein